MFIKYHMVSINVSISVGMITFVGLKLYIEATLDISTEITDLSI